MHSRRVAGTLSTLLLALVALAGLASPAQAEDGYRYWNYFHLEKGGWAFSKVGVAEYKPKDGAVEGFRYGVSTASRGIEPRADLAKVNFDTICGHVKAPAGKKRVAVVLDFGTKTSAGTPPRPRADCAVVDGAASTMQVLDAVAKVRAEKGMMCALDGYPASGCGEPVKDAKVPGHEQSVSFAMPRSTTAGSAPATTTSQQAQDGGHTGLWTSLAVAVLVVLIAIAALVMGRRSRHA